MAEFTDDEIIRLKQSVCDHEPDDSTTCYCCDQIHSANCVKCGVGYEPEPDCHDPEDPDYPYCSSCN